LSAGTQVHEAKGCDACGGTGYRGRLPVYEIVAATSALQSMIHEGASEAALTDEARKTSSSILQDGVEKIRSGHTTIAEVARVVREDSASGGI